MGVTAPPRPELEAPPQHLLALAEANRVRYARAGIKRKITAQPSLHASRQLAAGYIADPPPELATMRVLDLLLACRRLGLRKAQKMLGAVPLLEGKVIGSLTARQRQVLVLMLARSAT